jgi:hypothetical protein
MSKRKCRTVEQWRQCDDPERMLGWVWDRMSDRKRRLFAVACCRRRIDLLNAECRDLLDVAERFARGLADGAELAAAHEAAYATVERDVCPCCADAHGFAPWLACSCASQADHVLRSVWRDACDLAERTLERRWQYHDENEELSRRQAQDERKATCDLLREQVPCPAAAVRLSPDWRRFQRGVILAIAAEIDHSEDYRLMAVLADALQDAGCTDAVILGHARQTGSHAAGCWLLDLLLGRD